jgi:hypothetical protein
MKKIIIILIVAVIVVSLTGCNKPVILSIDDNSPILEDINSFNVDKMVDDLILTNKDNYYINKDSRINYTLSSLEKENIESKVEKYENMYNLVENRASSKDIMDIIKTFDEYKNLPEAEYMVYEDYLKENLELINTLNLRGNFKFNIFYNKAFKSNNKIFIPMYQYINVESIDNNKDNIISNFAINNNYYEEPKYLRLKKFIDVKNEYDKYDKEIYVNNLLNAYNRYIDAQGKTLIIVKNFVTFDLDGNVLIPDLMTNSNINTRITNAEKAITNYKISDWSFKFVFDNYASNLIEDGEFIDMTENMTREEFVKPIVRLYEKRYGTIKVPGNPFIDTSDIYVKKAYYSGLVSGIGENKFAPKSVLTREQSATIASRLLNLGINGEISEGLNYNQSSYKKYKDHYSIASWALKHVEYLKVKGIMIGYNNKFNGQEKLTREQGLTITSRIKNYVK